MKIYQRTAFVSFSIFLFMSCQQSSQKNMLIGRWQYITTYEMNGVPSPNDSLEKAIQEDNRKISLEFQSNDSFRSVNLATKEVLTSGAYKLMEKEKTLLLVINNNPTPVNIISLNTDTFKYEMAGDVMINSKIKD